MMCVLGIKRRRSFQSFWLTLCLSLAACSASTGPSGNSEKSSGVTLALSGKDGPVALHDEWEMLARAEPAKLPLGMLSFGRGANAYSLLKLAIKTPELKPALLRTELAVSDNEIRLPNPAAVTQMLVELGAQVRKAYATDGSAPPFMDLDERIQAQLLDVLRSRLSETVFESKSSATSPVPSLTDPSILFGLARLIGAAMTHLPAGKVSDAHSPLEILSRVMAARALASVRPLADAQRYEDAIKDAYAGLVGGSFLWRGKSLAWTPQQAKATLDRWKLSVPPHVMPLLEAAQLGMSAWRE